MERKHQKKGENEDADGVVEENYFQRIAFGHSHNIIEWNGK